MRVFNIFIIILSTLVFFALGSLLLATALSDTAVNWLSHAWLRYEESLHLGLGVRVGVGLAGVLMMVLAASTVLGNLRNRRYERAVVFHNPHGEVMIALGALEDLGKVVKAEVAGLKDVRLRVQARGKGLKVMARVTLWSDANLPKTTELIQESVRRYLQEIVGPDQEIRPRVVVSKVAYRDPDDYEAESEGEFRPRRIRRPVV